MAGASVYVGVLLVTIETPGVRSLKEKRGLLLPVTERLKARFPVSVARLDGLDAHDWERIGLAAISGDRAWLERTLDGALRFVERRGLSVRASNLDIEVWDVD
ncbi:MAG: DUF503 domain-containing protein [Deinococcales bacterium]